MLIGRIPSANERRVKAALALILLAALVAPAQAAPWPICGDGRRVTCVVDGDTIWRRGEKIRLAGIDAPEILSPDCPAERRRGLRARDALAAILARGPVALERKGTGVYGRTLARVRVAGRDAGAELVRRGHAAPNPKGRPTDWCEAAR